MRTMILLLALCALLALPACQSGPGPSSSLDLQPGVGGGARLFASPQEGVGCAARVDLGKYGFRTGKAAEPAPVAPQDVQDGACAGGACGLPAVPEAPVAGAGGQP